jgi:hypothetical protein
MDRAAAFALSAKMVSALRAASAEPELWSQARRDSAGFLESRGVQVPKGFDLWFLDEPIGMPGPDYEPFTIRLFNCRTYWTKKKNGPGYEKSEICYGFEITAVPRPGGPIG